MRRNGVDCLLMGGQACVLYGGAEFSRDIDFVLHVDSGNLARLSGAVDELQARVIAVPPFAKDYLDRGHAVHFRCEAPGTERLRIDVMSRLRGVDPFEMRPFAPRFDRGQAHAKGQGLADDQSPC